MDHVPGRRSIGFGVARLEESLGTKHAPLGWWICHKLVGVPLEGEREGLHAREDLVLEKHRPGLTALGLEARPCKRHGYNRRSGVALSGIAIMSVCQVLWIENYTSATKTLCTAFKAFFLAGGGRGGIG